MKRDTRVIMAVILLNSIIGYVQGYKAELEARALRKMLIPRARGLRNGKETGNTSGAHWFFKA